MRGRFVETAASFCRSPAPAVGAKLAREDGLIAGLVLAVVPDPNCGSETGLPAKAALVLASVHIHCCGCGYWWFRPDGRLPLANAPKEAKVSPQASGPSPRLGVPSLRYPSGGIALRFASLHLHAMCSTAPNGAVRQSPDEYLRSASRRGGQIKIKSCRRATARPVEWWKSARWTLLFVGASLLAKAACPPTNL